MNRTVLVTGASRGIGAAIARNLAQNGWGVIAAARTLAKTKAVADELERTFGGFSAAVQMDVSDPDSVRRGVGEAQAAAGDFGPIEALVNNAGIAISAPLLSDHSESGDLFERHMQVNFHGARRVAEELLPGMIERRRGSIVNVASSAGLRGYAYVAAYCASKHALIGWTRAAAAELESKGICIHAICPHYVDSPMLEESIRRLVDKTGMSVREVREFFASQNPGGQLVRPETVAEAVSGLLDLQGSGTILELDGS